MNTPPIITRIAGALAIAATACTAAEATETAEVNEEPATSMLSQPGEIPGKWDMKTPQPYPPIERAYSRTEPGFLVYGLYSWAGEYLLHRDDIKAVGWRSVRISGPFHDHIMKALVEDNMTAMVGVDNWLLDSARGANRTDYDTDDAFIDDYASRIDGFLNRYGPDGSFFDENPGMPSRPIVDLELWNEPNFQYMIPPDERPRPEVEAAREALYAKLLPRVYRSVKDAHEDVKVIAFATGGMSAGDLRFIQHVHGISPDIASSYDVLSTHPYVRPAPPEANSVQPWGSYSIARNLSIIRDNLDQHGRGDTPVWYTEIGWPILQEDGGYYPSHRPHECVPPLLQAAYVCRLYALALRLNVERVHIMYVTDADHFNAGFFAKNTREWRPSATAVQTMIGVMPSPKLTGAISDGEDGCHIYTYLADEEQAPGPGNKVIMAWNIAGPKSVELNDLPERVTLTDMMGHTETRETVAGVLSLEVGPYPVYIRAAQADSAEAEETGNDETDAVPNQSAE